MKPHPKSEKQRPGALPEVRAVYSAKVSRMQAHLTETVWLVAVAYGADRDCPGCQKVVRKLDARESGYACLNHHPRKS